MNAAQLAQEANRVNDLLRLVHATEALVPKSQNGRKALALLACQEKRLHAMRRRLLEAALVELGWQYMEYVEGTDEGYVVRQMMADIAAHKAMSDER